ncbi:MAG: hypothetical protein ACREUG_10355, partial [Steroidobacteraceae bacterium]
LSASLTSGSSTPSGIGSPATAASATPAANATGVAGAASASAASANASLQQSFDGLVAAMGGASGGQATLGNFLNAFAGDLSGRSTGSLLSAHA